LSVARVGPILFKKANSYRYRPQLLSSRALHSNFQCLTPTIVPKDACRNESLNLHCKHQRRQDFFVRLVHITST
jgi:hypothetical protein